MRNSLTLLAKKVPLDQFVCEVLKRWLKICPFVSNRVILNLLKYSALLQKCFIQVLRRALLVLKTFLKEVFFRSKELWLCFQEEVRPPPKKGYSGEFKEGCAPSPKRPLPGISRRNMLPLQKGLFLNFKKKRSAPQPKRPLPGNSRRDKSYSIHEIQEGICPLSKKDYSKKFKEGYSPKKAIPGNSRSDVLP